MSNEAKKKYDIQYAKDKLKRIPLNVQKEKYAEIKAAADAAGESVNGYIKKAIDERIKHTNPNTKPEPEPVITPNAAAKKHYKPFTKSDAAKVNLQELQTNIQYQLDIIQTFGIDVLAKLLEKTQ